MSKKLWVAHVTPSKTFGPTRVSIDGCEYVDDFKGIIRKILFKVVIRKNPQLAIPQNTPITLYTSDGTTEIDVEVSPSSLEDGKSGNNPLIVRIVEIAEESSIIPKASSNVASVLRSKMTIGQKESILKEFILSKEREVQSKEREVQSHVSLVEALKEKTQRIEAERDFLKGTLDARHIFENYELQFPKPNPKAAKPTRAERWKKHLDLNTSLREKLEECDKKILWHDKAAEIYDELCRNIHQRTIDIGNGKYTVMIEKSLLKTSSCFVKALANELYGDSVVVQEDTLGPATSEMEAS
jgi:hypothetical protein